MMTGKWLFHNFSANYFEAGSPVTPFEIIPRVHLTPLLDSALALLSGRALLALYAHAEPERFG